MPVLFLQDKKKIAISGILGYVLVVGTAALLQTTPVAAADEPADASATALDEVVITSRKREEAAQDVPIPVSVLGGKQLDQSDSVTLEDLQKQAPGLEATTPNSRRTGISIRGIGKSAGNDALEASMGVIVDDVFLSHPGMSYQDFTDLDRIEVLRGPQGTLIGKNTTIGAINYVSKLPTFTPEATLNVFLSPDGLGSHETHTVNGSASDALLDNLLAYRASFFYDRQAGDIENVNAIGGRTSEKNRDGGRLQFLLTPSDGFSARFNLDYAESNERSNTKPIIEVLSHYDDAAQSPRVTDPGGTVAQQNKALNTYASIFQRGYFGGYTPIIGSWSKEDLNQNVPLITTNQGASAILNWDLGGYKLTSITAVRGYTFDAKNDSDQTKFDIAWSGTHIDAGQQSQEFRLASDTGGVFDYQTGLFFLHSWNTSTNRTYYGSDAGAYYAKNGDYNVLYNTAAGKQLLQASLNNVYATTAITPDTKSYAAFGQGNWHFSDKLTLTVGLRDTYEDKTNSSTKAVSFLDGSALDNLAVVGTGLGATAQEISSAQNIRTTTLGTTYAQQQGEPISGSALSWLLSPSYKLNDDVLLYSSASSGQKSGSVQFSSAGTPLNVKPEKVFDLEAGFKSLLLDRRLLLNINLYQTTVKDYQQTTSIFDAATTALKNDGTLYYQSVLGNIPEIRARGIELDGAYSATPNLSFNFGAVVNDAIYTDWHTATCPSELNVKSTTTVCDNTGKQVVAAPKFIGILGANYQKPFDSGYVGHAWFNEVFRTSQNFDNTLSRYGVQPAYALTDAGIGLTAPSGRYEIDLQAKNLFDKKYTTSINVGSDGSIAYDGIGARRWVGIALHMKL